MKVVMLRCRANDKCRVQAKALIIVENETMWAGKSVLEALPLCADHAPEYAHETAISMNEDEFLVIELPAFGVGALQ